MIPRAFVGSGEGGGIYALSQGHRDGGEDVDFYSQGNPTAPGGADMDCAFNRVFITLTWSMNVTVRCTPIVNNVPLTGSAFDIELTALPTAQRTSRVFERTLEREQNGYKAGLRGTWFALLIESVEGVDHGDIIVDEVVLDNEVLSPTKEPVP